MAAPASGAARKKSSWSTPLLFLSFGLVFLILFQPALRDATGRWVGYALDPAIGFGGRYPVLTIFFASVLLVIGTTTIRHFLVDWTLMARTQEVMRKFQKEFSDARKANNTYKIKRLTEAQPKVFEMQADLQKDQLKPMAFTMLLVIPLFAWLGTHVVAPVELEMIEAPTTPVIVAATRGEHINAAWIASDANEGKGVLTTSVDVYGYSFFPPGSSNATAGTPIVLENTRTDERFTVNAAGPAIPESARVGELASGTYTFRMAAPNDTSLILTGPHDPYRADGVLLVVMQDGALQHALAVGTNGATVTLSGPSQLYAVVKDGQIGGEVSGTTILHVTGASTQDFTIDADNVVAVDVEGLGAPIYPYSAKLPWQDPWSLQDAWWILPHWILLYSLFGIPFGQIAQRALKLWEYRHVDLDKDGRQAGESL